MSEADRIMQDYSQGDVLHPRDYMNMALRLAMDTPMEFVSTCSTESFSYQRPVTGPSFFDGLDHDHYTRLAGRYKCEYCGQHTMYDSRGGCQACGAPKG
jgi:hypothetical protein